MGKIIVRCKDGLSDTTEIIDKDTGNHLDNVELIRLEAVPGGLWEATMVFFNVELEIEAEVIPEDYCKICQGQCKYYTPAGTPILPANDITNEEMRMYIAHLLQK